MTNTKELQIENLLDGTGKAGPELTHGLSELGGGKMADGLVALWKSGQKSGMIKGATITTLAFSAVIGGYVLIKNAVKDRKMKRILKESEISAVDYPAEAPMADGTKEKAGPTEQFGSVMSAAHNC